MKIDAVILAKSTMWGAFCVAGLDVNNDRWVRFVSFEDGDPLADYQLMFMNSPGSCQPLDVGRISIAREIPKRNHSEDVMIKRDLWLKLGRMTIDDVLKFHPAEEYRYIFGNDCEYVTEGEMMRLGFRYSLILVHVQGLSVRYEQNFSGKIRGRAEFSYNGVCYRNIRVTDPEYEHGKGSVNFGEAFLVMSMPVKPFRENGRYYKLIAKIFTKESR